MPARIVLVAAAVAVLLLAACEDTPQTPPLTPMPTHTPTSVPPTSSPYEGYLTEKIPPCTPMPGSSVDPCEPRGPIETLGAVGGQSPAHVTDEPLTIRQFLDGLGLSFIPHVVLRGTYIPDTVRCTSGDPFYVPSYASPGYYQHSIVINCYADVRVNEYILGSGPPRLTALVDFHHYWEGYYAGVEDYTEEEFVELARQARKIILEEGPRRTGEGIYGREVILFVGPPNNHAHEVWEVVETWDVQRQEDGMVIAVHPHRDDWRGARPDKYREYRSRLEMELPRFKKEVLAAQQARVTEYSGRIASADIQGVAEGAVLPLLISDAHGLGGYMVSTGAYDHPEGAPTQPPPIPGADDTIPGLTVDDSTPGPTPVIPGAEEESSLPVVP